MNSTPAQPAQNRMLGIALRIGATTSFAFMAAMIKLGYEAGIALPELVFYRFAFGLPPLLAWIDMGGWPRRFRSSHPWRARPPGRGHR